MPIVIQELLKAAQGAGGLYQAAHDMRSDMRRIIAAIVAFAFLTTSPALSTSENCYEARNGGASVPCTSEVNQLQVLDSQVKLVNQLQVSASQVKLVNQLQVSASQVKLVNQLQVSASQVKLVQELAPGSRFAGSENRDIYSWGQSLFLTGINWDVSLFSWKAAAVVGLIAGAWAAWYLVRRYLKAGDDKKGERPIRIVRGADDEAGGEVTRRLVNCVRSKQITLKDLYSYYTSLSHGAISKSDTSLGRLDAAAAKVMGLLNKFTKDLGLLFENEKVREDFGKDAALEAIRQLEFENFKKNPPKGPTLRSIVMLIGAGLLLGWWMVPFGEAPLRFALDGACLPDRQGWWMALSVMLLPEIADTLLPNRENPNHFASIPEGELGVIEIGMRFLKGGFFERLIKSNPDIAKQMAEYSRVIGQGGSRREAELAQLNLKGRQATDEVFEGKVSELEQNIIWEGVRERWFSLAEVMRRLDRRSERVSGSAGQRIVEDKKAAQIPKKQIPAPQPKRALPKAAPKVPAPEKKPIPDDDVEWLQDFVRSEEEEERSETDRAAEAARLQQEAQDLADKEWDARLQASLERVMAQLEAARKKQLDDEAEKKRQEEEAERQRQAAEAAKKAEIERRRREAEDAREREKRKLDDLLKWFIQYAKEVNRRLTGIIAEAQKKDEPAAKEEPAKTTGISEEEVAEIWQRLLLPAVISDEEDAERFLSNTSRAVEKAEKEAGEFIGRLVDDFEEEDKAEELKRKRDDKAKSLRALLITINRNKDKFKDAKAKADKIKNLRARIELCASSLERKRNEKAEIVVQLDGIKARLINIIEDAENTIRGLKNLVRKVVSLNKKRRIEKYRRDLIELLETEKSREDKIYRLLKREEAKVKDILERRRKLNEDLETKKREIAETMAELERLMSEIIEIEEMVKNALPDAASKTEDEVIIEGLDEAAQPMRNKVYRLAAETKDGIEKNRNFVVTTLGSLGLANTDEKIEQVTSRKDKLGKGSPEIEDAWLRLARERVKLERLRNKFKNEQALLREAQDKVKRIEKAASERQREMEKHKREGKLEEFEKALASDRAACEMDANELENLKKIEEARRERLKRYEFLINERKKRVADNLEKLTGLINEAEEPRATGGTADEALDFGKLEKEFSELSENINRDFAEDERLHGELVALVEGIEKGGGIQSGLYRAARNSNKERPGVHAQWRQRIEECRSVISEAIIAKGAELGEAHRKLEVLRGIAKELERWVRDDTRRLSELEGQTAGEDEAIDKEIDNLRNGADAGPVPAEEEAPQAVSQKDPLLRKREMIADMIRDFAQLVGGPIYPSLQNLRMHTDTAKWIEVFSEGRLRRDGEKMPALSDSFIAYSLGQIKPEKRDGSSNAAAERTRYYNEAGLSMDAQRKAEEFLRRFELWMRGRRGAVESIMLDVSSGLGITDAVRSRQLRGAFIRFELKVQEEARYRDMKNRTEREEAEAEIKIATQELLKDIASVILRTEAEEEKWLVGLIERYASFAKSEANAPARMDSENPHLELNEEDREKLYSIIFAIQSHDLLRGEKESFRALFERRGLRGWIGYAASFIDGSAVASDWLETARLGHSSSKKEMADRLRVKIMAMDDSARETLREYLERLNNYRGSPLYIDKEGTIKVAYAGVRKEQMLADAEDSARGVGHEALWENIFGSEGRKMMHFCAGQNLNAVIDRLRGRLKVDVPRGSRVESAFPSNSLMGEILHTILRRKERNLGIVVQVIDLSIFRERVEAEYRREHGMPLGSKIERESLGTSPNGFDKPDGLRTGLLAPASRFGAIKEIKGSGGELIHRIVYDERGRKKCVLDRNGNLLEEYEYTEEFGDVPARVTLTNIKDGVSKVQLRLREKPWLHSGTFFEYEYQLYDPETGELLPHGLDYRIWYRDTECKMITHFQIMIISLEHRTRFDGAHRAEFDRIANRRIGTTLINWIATMAQEKNVMVFDDSTPNEYLVRIYYRLFKNMLVDVPKDELKARGAIVARDIEWELKETPPMEEVLRLLKEMPKFRFRFEDGVPNPIRIVREKGGRVIRYQGGEAVPKFYEGQLDRESSRCL